MTDNPDDDWKAWWDARVAAIETVLGKSEDTVGHAMIPFQFGPEMGGAADVIYFRRHLPGRVSVTSELIGCEEQIPGDLGAYELMICHRDEEEWGPNLISQLAHYTLQAKLNPGETMDIGPAAPEGSTITALLFLEYARFTVRDRQAGLLLCLGVTAEELKICRKGRYKEVVEALKKADVFPYTDLHRPSAVKRKGWW